MNRLRWTLSLLAIAAVLSRGTAFAQTGGAHALPVPGPIQAKGPLTAGGDTDSTVWLKGTGFVSASVYVTNNGAAPLTITAVGANPVLFSPVPPTLLRPGERKPVVVTINMDATSFPTTGPLFFRTDDGTGAPSKAILTTVTFASKDVVMLDSMRVRWDIGEAPVTKTVAITNVPEGVKVTGAEPLNPNPGFDVAFHGNTVSVTPKSTAAPEGEPVQIKTDPASARPVIFLAYVMSPQVRPPKSEVPHSIP